MCGTVKTTSIYNRYTEQKQKDIGITPFAFSII